MGSSGRIAFYNPLVKGVLPNYEKAEKKLSPSVLSGLIFLY